MDDKFYMVYVDGGNNPSKQHATIDEACDEARRLARYTKRTAFVLEAVCGYRIPEEPPLIYFTC
jgi:hypothetical protein